MPFEDVEVLHGDTAIATRGLDTYGSRSLVVGGQALVMAADRVIEKAKPVAAHMLEASADDIEFAAERLHGRGTDSRKGLAEVVWETFTSHDLPEGVEPTLDAGATYDPVDFSFPHGTHLCAVEVDTENRAGSLRSYVSVDDIGVIINPLIVAGQIHGGLAQEVAQALWEEAVHDEQGTLVTGSFVDYTLPTAADLISFTNDNTVSPSTTNDLGAKERGGGGMHRLHTGRGQRHRGRAPADGRQRHPDAVHPRAGVGGHSDRRQIDRGWRLGWRPTALRRGRPEPGHAGG